MKKLYLHPLLFILALFSLASIASAATIFSLDGNTLPSNTRSEGCQNTGVDGGAIKVTTYYSSCVYSYDLRSLSLPISSDFTLTYRAKHSADSQYNFTNLMLIGEGDGQAIFRGYSPASYRLDLLGRFGQTYESIDQTTFHTYSLVAANRIFSFYIDGNLQSTWQNPLSEGESKKWEELRFGTISATSSQLASIWFDSIEFTTPTLATPTPTNSASQAPVATPAPTPVPGDANADRIVNEADYLAWYNSYTQSPDGTSPPDFDKNGVVDGFDYVIWLENAE